MNFLIKRTFSLGLCSALLVAGGVSCQTEKLDPVPQTLIPAANIFDTPLRVQLQLSGVYSFVKAGAFLGGRYQVYGDIRANDFTNRTANNVTGLSVWNHTVVETSVNDVINLWTQGYQAINQANLFLAGLDANESRFVPPTFPATFPVNAYRGEARLLRALSYYSLLQLYARPFIDGNGSRPGLPLRLQGETGPGNNDLARSTVAEVYEQILRDLNFAEQNLPLTNGSALNNVTRAHRNTAIALKTRVYLSMGRYNDVITEANKIVPMMAPFQASSGVAHALAPSVSAVFAPPQETSESILSFPFSAQDTPGTQNQLGFYFLPIALGGNGEYGFNPSGILGDMTAWPTADTRRSLVTRVGTESFLTKYTTPVTFTDKAPVIRYAEVLLSLAEARARTAGAADPQALALLNAVRVRSNPVPAGQTTSPAAYTAASFTSTFTIIDAILQERRIEFLGEGLRNIDLMRLNATIPGKGTVAAVPPSRSNYIWPIPQPELATNRLMTRND